MTCFFARTLDTRNKFRVFNLKGQQKVNFLPFGQFFIIGQWSQFCIVIIIIITVILNFFLVLVQKSDNLKVYLHVFYFVLQCQLLFPQ